MGPWGNICIYIETAHIVLTRKGLAHTHPDYVHVQYIYVVAHRSIHNVVVLRNNNMVYCNIAHIKCNVHSRL